MAINSSPTGDHAANALRDKAIPPEDLQLAEKAGAKIVAYSPDRVRSFLLGGLTLGELEGITKDEQYEMAREGYGFIEQEDFDSARKVFEGLLALDPYDAYFHTSLGWIAQNQGELSEAEERYSRALEINPYSAVALANRGELRILSGNLVDGANDLTQAIREDPTGQEPATRRAIALAARVRQQLGQRRQ